jgi:glycosyltransferase involved in cell wall biosynthesis
MQTRGPTPPTKAHKVARWAIAAGFFESPESSWLDDFIQDPGLSFTKVPPARRIQDWHFGKARTDGRGWIAYFRHAYQAFRLDPDGIITCFPQLAIAAGAIRRLGRRKPRLIAYNFNLGSFPGGLRRALARFGGAAVDRFVVHSPQEIARYARYFGLPEERFRFLPLQRGDIGLERVESDPPFLLSMGSAHRDYATLIAAVDRLGLPTVIVTRADAIKALPASPHVTFRSGLSQQQCLALLARARLLVTPVSNLDSASGQVTFLNALRLGVATITTRCPGTEGYIEHLRNGVLVEPFDVEDMVRQIALLWTDRDLRERLAGDGRSDAAERFSDPAAAARLHDLIRGL